MYDVIVVGAGPAGALAAKKCAELGLKVIMIEKEKIPRTKPCGGGVSSKALELVESSIPRHLIEREVKGFRFFSADLQHVDLVSEKIVGISTKRDHFDAFLTKIAVDKGSELLDGKKVVQAIFSKDKVICKLNDGSSIESHIVIGADGVNSTIAKDANIRCHWNPDRVGLCLVSIFDIGEQTLERVMNPNLFELYFINLPLGYGWVFPKRASLSVGIGAVLSQLRSPRTLFTDFCGKVSKLKNIELRDTGIQAHLVPAGGFSRDTTSERVILVGDAAGFVDHLTGEGIYYAMKSGIIAANVCSQAVENGRFDVMFLARYVKMCEESFGRDLKVALDLTYKIHDHMGLFFRILKTFSNSSDFWAELARGEVKYRSLRRKVVTRFPQEFLMLFWQYIRTKIGTRSLEWKV